MALNFKRSFLFLAVISLLVFSIGCSTMSVSVQKGVPKLQKDAKIAYFKGIFSDIDFPTFPLLDAALYKNKVKDNINKFKEVEKNSKEQIAAYTAQSIKQKTGNQVIVTDSPLDANDFYFLDNISTEIEAKIAAECKKVNAAYAFIPVMRVKVNGVSAFGITGSNYFESKIYVCDKNGKIIGNGYISTESDVMDSADTTRYQILIKSGEPLLKQLINLLFQ